MHCFYMKNAQFMVGFAHKRSDSVKMLQIMSETSGKTEELCTREKLYDKIDLSD